MTARDVVFVPLLPAGWLIGLAIVTALPLLLGAARRATGTVWRAACCAVLLLWLCGPRRVVRTGTPLPDIGLLVVDRSASMTVGSRARMAEATAAALQRQAAGRPDLVLRRVDVPEAGTGGTRLFGAIDPALADIPASQRAGVVAITDGAVADVPEKFDLPLDVLIPAAGEQIDRRLRVTLAPGFGVVGQSVPVGFTVEDLGSAAAGTTARVTWSVAGGAAETLDVTVGQPAQIAVPITRAGRATVSLSVAALPGEASLLNNRAALTINGVRDRLRVLLISGQPHAGERTWRRLLKSDPSVDLVHFTLLRPPGTDDLTPLRDLALIAFPIRELFVEKIRGFDLIVLDRFSNSGLLPPSYLENIAQYVRDGGALLVSAGPELAGPGSIAEGPIGAVLPGGARVGADAVVDGAFRPVVTALGERHPVTEALPGDVPGATPGWGEWYRRVMLDAPRGQVVMTAGSGGAPLLVLDRVGKGRVALLLSDQIWLWARGHEGGGPQAELLRRVAHWSMQEPELDEDALTASITAGTLTVERHSTDPAAAALPLRVTGPDGGQTTAHFTDEEGRLLARLPASTPGVWQVWSSDRTATAAAQPTDPVEYADLRATATRLRPLAASIRWLDPGGAPPLSELHLRRRGAVRLTNLQTPPLLPAGIALAGALALLLIGWWRERG